jgi:hypothetical protein
MRTRLQKAQKEREKEEGRRRGNEAVFRSVALLIVFFSP